MKATKIGMKSVASLIICAQLLSACSDKGFESLINPSSINQDTVELGTGDGGGGNAINYKMLESYMIDPNKLDIVKNRLVKIFDVMFEGHRQDNEKPNTDQFLKMKNWYLAPLSLKVIPKEVLGIEFTKDRHQQVAIQTKQAIWIDSNIFNKMSDQDKATLVLHEVVMSLYLHRFMTLEELCMLSKKSDLGGCGVDDSEDLEYFKAVGASPRMKPESSRPLNEKDYEIIRQMTSWLLANEGKMTFESYEKYADQIGFRDSRFPLSSSQSIEGVSLEYTALEFETAMNRSILTGQMKSKCLGELTNTERPCVLKFKKLDEKFDLYGRSAQKYQLDLIDEGTQKVLRTVKFIQLEVKNLITAYDSEVQVHLHTLELIEEAQLGKAYDQVLLSFKVDDENKLVNLKSAVFTKVMIISEPTPYPNSSESCFREIETLSGKLFSDEAIIVGNGLIIPISGKIGAACK